LNIISFSVLLLSVTATKFMKSVVQPPTY